MDSLGKLVGVRKAQLPGPKLPPVAASVEDIMQALLRTRTPPPPAGDPSTRKKKAVQTRRKKPPKVTN